MKLRKTVCAVLTALTISALFTAAIPASAASFTDVEETDWFAGDVAFVSKTRIMTGTSDGKFSPNDNMTRAMFITALWRAEGEKNAAGVPPFTDLGESWYRDAVAWGYEQRLVFGKTETSFAPGDPMTREELVTFVYRYALMCSGIRETRFCKPEFADLSSVAPYARGALQWAVTNGIVIGEERDGNRYFMPRRSTKRCEVSAILKRYFEPTAETPLNERGIIGKCRYDGTDNYRAVAHSKSDVEKIIIERESNLFDFGGAAELNGVSFADTLRSYDDGFFENGSLLVAFFSTTSGSHRYSLIGITKNGNGYVVSLKATSPGMGTCDMAEWCVIAELPEKNVAAHNVSVTVGGSPLFAPSTVLGENGLSAKIRAYNDVMPTTSGGYGNAYLSVEVSRDTPDGTPIPDIAVSVRLGIKEYVLVTGSESSDKRVYILNESDRNGLSFPDGGTVSGRLTYGLGSKRESADFRVPVLSCY